jgi:hypothetical protein
VFGGGRVGIGFGIGGGFDPLGGRPGSTENGDYCGSGTTAGGFATGTANAGPLQYPLLDAHGGYDTGTGKSYGGEPKVADGTAAFGKGEGLELAAIAGVEVVGYGTVSCKCNKK